MIYNKYLSYCIITLVMAYVIPMGGIFMDGMWYKYTYILGTHIIGLLLFWRVFKWYLKNDK